MTDAKRLRRTSKTMSYVLRHDPDAIGIELDEAGWVDITEFLAAMNTAGHRIDRKLLVEVVSTNDKQRFEIDQPSDKIRARQGHSVSVDLGYPPLQPPDVLYHGTASRFLISIMEEGLHRGNRHHVHLSTNHETMIAVGGRHGRPVVLAIDAKTMHANGHLFYKTDNNVWLTEAVPPEYIRQTE